MGLIEAIVLGIVQGLTEFLPISSTAHIRIIPALVGWRDPGAPFTAIIQLGTLLAVLIYFRHELWASLAALVRATLRRRVAEDPDARMGWAIIVGTLPIVIMGVLYKSQIERELRSLYVIAFALIGMGALLGAAEMAMRHWRHLEDVRARDGLWVGLWQAIALIPGASRSGSTITGGLLAGFDRPSAAKFSFLLSVPSVLAAGLFSLREHSAEMSGEMLMPAIVANIASFASGYAAIALLLRYLQSRGVGVFVLYRVLLGVAILILLRSGLLHPMAGIGSSAE